MSDLLLFIPLANGLLGKCKYKCFGVLKQILMDSSGVLKYADFGLAKVEGENLEELFYKFADAGEQWNTQSVEEIVKQNSISGFKKFFLFRRRGKKLQKTLTDLVKFFKSLVGREMPLELMKFCAIMLTFSAVKFTFKLFTLIPFQLPLGFCSLNNCI